MAAERPPEGAREFNEGPEEAVRPRQDARTARNGLEINQGARGRRGGVAACADPEIRALSYARREVGEGFPKPIAESALERSRNGTIVLVAAIMSKRPVQRTCTPPPWARRVGQARRPQVPLVSDT